MRGGELCREIERERKEKKELLSALQLLLPLMMFPSGEGEISCLAYPKVFPIPQRVKT